MNIYDNFSNVMRDPARSHCPLQKSDTVPPGAVFDFPLLCRVELGGKMYNVYVGKSYNGNPTAELEQENVKSFKDFSETHLRICRQGKKNEKYITIGNEYEITPGDPEEPTKSYKSKDHFHRNNHSQLTAWLLPFDGDNSETSDDGCIRPIRVHKALKKLNLNHVIYTTHSHVRNIKNRWRLFLPCEMNDKIQLQPTVDKLLKLLKENGCNDLLMSNESKTWSIPWFLPTREDPDDGGYEYYLYSKGIDFIPEDGVTTVTPDPTTSTTGSPAEEMIDIICTGASPLHETLRNYIWGSIKDGRAPAWLKVELHKYTENYDMSDPRLKKRKDDIDRIIDLSYKKLNSYNDDWVKSEEDNERYYTRYPDQGGNMEKMIDTCMKWMIFPNRQIAVTACHTLISTLGGRVYTTEDGGGIVLTVLVTGRSTIGKSNIKKFCVYVLNNFMLNKVASEFIGSHYYTSGANLIKELQNSGTLLSVRTESGQSDKSQAGDMKRVMLYELELATESGRDGYISSGGQNDKIPDLYSPAVTTVRESVAEIQNEADLQNNVSVAGTSGRRSHVIIDSIKNDMNDNRMLKFPKWFKDIIYSLYELAKDERRKAVDDPLPDSAWVYIKYEDKKYLKNKADEWIELENEAALKKDHFISTFYGRLHERVPAFAARLAIVDNPAEPVITNKHVDIAEESLKAEVFAHRKQDTDSGNLWESLVDAIVDVFQGDMTKRKTLHYSGFKMLRDGACMWKYVRKVIQYNDSYKILCKKDNFEFVLTKKLEYANIFLMDTDESKKKYNKRAKIYFRG